MPNTHAVEEQHVRGEATFDILHEVRSMIENVRVNGITKLRGDIYFV
jgi:hypothetical protein